MRKSFRGDLACSEVSPEQMCFGFGGTLKVCWKFGKAAWSFVWVLRRFPDNSTSPKAPERGGNHPMSHPLISVKGKK